MTPRLQARSPGLSFPYVLILAFVLIGAWTVVNLDLDRSLQTSAERTPDFILSPALPLTSTQVDLSCARNAKDITGCSNLNQAALPVAANAWGRATVEQRLACHEPYPMPLRVNLALSLLECFERTGVVSR